jgi:predicted transposase YdaD
MELLEGCEPLRDYSWFVDGVVNKQVQDRQSLARAIDETINEMPDDFVIKQFLLDNKAEVKRMWITEYDEKRVLAQQLEDGIEIGREEGIEIGREEGQIKAMKAMAKKLFKEGWSVEKIAEFEEVDAIDVKIWINENNN